MHDTTATPLYHRGLRVPFITAWSSETSNATRDPHLVLRTPVLGDGPLTAYTNEQPGERAHGVLWARMAESPGAGVPRFASLHTARQRAVMHAARCQICTEPGELWLAPVSVYERHLSVRGAAAPYETADPQVCRACLPTAISQCPNLESRGYVFLAPRRWETTKVRGFVADPDTLDLGDYTDIALPCHPRHDPRRARLALAKGLLATLQEPHAHTDVRAAGLGPRSGQSAAAFVRRHPKP